MLVNKRGVAIINGVKKERKKKMNRKKFNISLISDVKIKIFQKIIEKRQVMGGGRVNNS